MKISGVNGKVLYGSVVVAEMVSWSMSGISQPTASAPTAFGDTGAKVKEVTELPDPGTIEFSEVGTHLTNLYLYANTSTFWRVSGSGYIIVTKANAVTLPRSGFGTISFSGDVSSDFMEQVGTGS
jgi:hypothetical protein